MAKYFVSVLINNYNNDSWLRQCVDSVLGQTRSADEIIVYDDGSTDESLAILRSYGGRIHLIEGVHQDARSGIAANAAAIAAAFARCRGDHVYLLDGDDAFRADHLQLYEEAWARLPEAVMIQGSMVMINERGDVLRSMWEARRQRADYLKNVYQKNETDFFYATSALAFRRDFLAGRLPLAIPPGLCCAADARLAFAAVFSGPIGQVSEDTVLYRFRNGSMSDLSGLRRLSRIRESQMRADCFNQIAAEFGHRPIRLWLNITYLLQVLRHIAPGWMSDFPSRLKLAWANRRDIRAKQKGFQVEKC